MEKQGVLRGGCIPLRTSNTRALHFDLNEFSYFPLSHGEIIEQLNPHFPTTPGADYQQREREQLQSLQNHHNDVEREVLSPERGYEIIAKRWKWYLQRKRVISM